MTRVSRGTVCFQIGQALRVAREQRFYNLHWPCTADVRAHIADDFSKTGALLRPSKARLQESRRSRAGAQAIPHGGRVRIDFRSHRAREGPGGWGVGVDLQGTPSSNGRTVFFFGAALYC